MIHKKNNMNSRSKFDNRFNSNDTKTNDFDLNGTKHPPLSTVKKQIKQIDLIKNGTKSSRQTNFDRLKIAAIINDIDFEDIGLEDCENPEKTPSFLEYRNKSKEELRPFYDDNIETDEIDLAELFDLKDFDIDAEIIPEAAAQENITAKQVDIFRDRSVKRRIRYEDIKGIVGLNNLYLSKGYLVIDITGKFMAKDGILGSLNQNNIKEALEKILNLNIIKFDIDRFLEVAQIFICDIYVDIPLENNPQVLRYIEGVSSFFPLVTNRFSIAKYGRHGLQAIPKSKSLGRSLSLYAKGQELNHSLKRTTKATLYTDIIGIKGVELAKRTLRVELKLYKLNDIRDVLNIESLEKGVVKLTDVLNSTEPVLFKQLELFCGNIEELEKSIKWFLDTIVIPQNLTLTEILIAEKVIEIFKENNFDMSLVRSHFHTEYANINDSEVAKFIQLANIRLNFLNFLVYKKPKSTTIMLDILSKVQAYYNFTSESIE